MSKPAGDFEAVRENYPVLKKTAYLDASSMGPLPSDSCEAMCAFIRDHAENGTDIPQYDANWGKLDALRAKIAEMIGAEGPECIGYGLNSSTMMNLFANGIRLQPGDNVVLYDTAYPAMSYMWLNKKLQSGVDVRFAHAGEDGFVDENALFSLVDARTRAITVCWVDNKTGFRHDLEAIGRFCRQRDLFFAVDATQACGAMKLDAEACQVDFLTSSGYKWLQSPLGIGFLYCSGRLLRSIAQSEMGWCNVADRTKASDPLHYALSPAASRFECGGLNVIGSIGLSMAVDRYLSLGADSIEEHILSLVDALYGELERIPGAQTVHFPPAHRSGIVVVRLPRAWGVTDAILAENGIRAHMLSPEHLRVGIHYYNNMDDILRLCRFLAARR